MNEGKTKIFFDGNCIVCDTEVMRYKKMAPALFEIIDISAPSFDAAKFGLQSENLKFQMHLLTPEGEIKVGVDAFAFIWSQIKGLKTAARVIKLPVIYSLAKIGYRIFARYRHYLPKKPISMG